MLKPTVGIELWRKHGLENEPWFADATMGWTYSIVNSPPWKCKISDGKDGHNQSAYREHSQERRLSSILQANHGYIHFGCPIHRKATVNCYLSLLFNRKERKGTMVDGGDSLALRWNSSPHWQGKTYQNNRKSQS